MALKKIFILMISVLFLSPVASVALAAEEAQQKEPGTVQEEIAGSGMSLEQPREVDAEQNAESVLKGSNTGTEGRVEHRPEVEKEVAGKKPLDIDGGLVGFYQGGAAGKIEGNDMDMNNSAGFGIVADLQMTYGPPVPLLEHGRLFMHVHAGEGLGADGALGGKLFANLNAMADNSNSLQTNYDKVYWLEEAYYAHEFYEGKLTFFVGKTSPVIFIDTNAFANDPYNQFVGRLFVDNPVFDSEAEFAPIVAASFSPAAGINITALGVSSSYPDAPSKEEQKSIYSQIFVQPFAAVQLTYSPKFGGLQGNYRTYYWNASYPHINSAGDTSSNGWGLGLSFDQRITESLGLFARFAYSSRDAYDTDWFWSVGANLKGIIPSRDKDELGIGIAGVKGTVAPNNDGTELHTELYYRVYLTEHFAVSPDIQYVANPLGNARNSNVFAGMVRTQFSF